MNCDQYTAGAECVGHTPSIFVPNLPADHPPVAYLPDTGFPLINIVMLIFLATVLFAAAIIAIAVNIASNRHHNRVAAHDSDRSLEDAS